jgi:hypothetical protein
MNRITLLTTALLAGCVGSSSYYPSGQPQYASASQTTQTTNGSTTTTSSTTATYQAYEQPAPVPQPEPQPAVVVYEPAPAPVADPGPRCHARDNREMCIAVGVIYDVGRLLERLEERSCGKASRAINRYADNHDDEIEVLLSLEHTQTRPRLRQFVERHQAEVSLVIAQAMDLDSRCGGDDRFDRAMKRLGFDGLIGDR